jgi:hypothetical protein
MQSNIEKLAEELYAIVAPYPSPLDCTGLRISTRGGKHRIVMHHFIGPSFKFTFDFDKVMPFDPAGGEGKTDDVFAYAKISLSSPHGKPPSNPTKQQVDTYCDLFLQLVLAVLSKEARAGRISSKKLAEMRVTRPSKDRMDAASRDMIAWDTAEAMKKGDIIDATGAETVDQFIEQFVAKDNLALAAALKRDLNKARSGKEKGKNSARKRGKK